MSLVQYVTSEAQVQEHNCKEHDKEKWLEERAANFHFAHSSLLALVVIIFQAGKAYSKLDLNNIKYNNNTQSTVQKQYVSACMSHNILSDE